MEFSDVFLSYRRTDVDFVKQVDQALKATGREVWVDWEDIPPGVEGFADEILRGIQATNAFIAVLSPSYLESSYCLMELQEALRLKKKVIPIVYRKFDPAPPPDGIGHINWVYFTPHAGQENTFEESFPKVIDALEADFTYVRDHTRLLVRATDWDKHARSRGFLLNGAEIERAEAWLLAGNTKTPPPSPLHGEYVVFSRRQQLQQQQRISAVIGVLLVLAAIAAIFAVVQAIEAQRQESIARTAEAEALQNAAMSHSLSLAARSVEPGNEVISVALALEAARLENPPVTVMSNLMNVAYRPGIRQALRLEPLWWGHALAVSPDEQTIVAQNLLIDLETGATRLTFENTPSLVLAAAFTPNGQTVVIGGDKGFEDFEDESVPFLGLWDVATGALIRTFDTQIGVGRVQISPDGSTLVSYEPDRMRWWDIATGEPLREFADLTPPSGFVDYQAFSPDLSLFAYLTTDADNQSAIHIVNTVDNSEQTTFTVNVPDIGNIKLQFSPDGRQLAVIQSQFTLYDTQSGNLVTTYSGDTASTTALEFSADGRTVLSGGWDKQLIQWDRLSGERLLRFDGHQDQIIYVRSLAQGSRVLTVDFSGQLYLWDLQSGDLVETLHQSPLIPEGALTFYNEDWTFAVHNGALDAVTGVGSETAVVVDITNQTELQSFTIPDMTSIGRADFLDNSLLLLRVNTVNDMRLLLLNIASGEQQEWFQGNIWDVIPLPNGTQMLIQTQSPEGVGQIILFEITTGEQQMLFQADYILSIALLPNGTQMLIQTQSPEGVGQIILFEITTGEQQMLFQAAAIDDMTPLPNGTQMLITGYLSIEDTTQHLVLLDLATGEPIYTRPESIDLLWLVGDGSQFVTSEYVDEIGNSGLNLRDTQTGEVIRQLVSNAPDVSQLIISADQRYMFTVTPIGFGGGGESNSGFWPLISVPESQLRLWDFATGTLLRDYPTVGSLTLTEDQRTFTIDPEYGEVREITTWRLDSLEELIAWTCANRYVPPFTDEQRAQFLIDNEISLCETSQP